MNSRQLMVFGLAVLVLPCLAYGEIPQHDGFEHLGVQSCAASSCHGSAGERNTYAVLQNEYITWARHDLHAQAYKVLKNDQSKRIARNLGLEAAHTAKICLDCHSDNVPADRRGLQFSISDGVACEACHGGAEKWLGIHISGSGNKHEESLAAGLYPTEDPEARAELCLSCHLGTKDKFTTHEIMGAGHPRLSFDLQKFTDLQPRHYRVDSDYRARKNHVEDTRAWALGQVKAARNYMGLLQGPRMNSGGLFPELSLFDCHACHHAFKEQRWQANERSATPPGTVLLNDSSLAMSHVIATVVAPGSANSLLATIRELHGAAQNNRQEVRTVAANLDRQLGQLADTLKSREFDRQVNNTMIDTLSRAVGDQRFSDYSDAEQATMAMDVYSGVTGRYKQEVDALYEAVADAEVTDAKRFDPVMFAAVFNPSAGATPMQEVSTSMRAPAPLTPAPKTMRSSTRATEAPVAVAPDKPVQTAQLPERSQAHDETITPTHTVNTRALRVRYSPDAGSGIVGMIYKGDKIEVLETRGEWAQVAYKARNAVRRGWVASSLIIGYSDESMLVSADEQAAVSSDESALVSAEPAEQSTPPLVTRAPQSTATAPSRPAPAPAPVSASGSDSFAPTHKVGTEVLRVRFTPDAFARIAVLLNFGDAVQVLSEAGTWSQIAYLNDSGLRRTGWAASRLLSEGPPTSGSRAPVSAPKPAAAPAPRSAPAPAVPRQLDYTATHVVNANALRVRFAPDTSAGVREAIYFGDEVGVIDTSGDWAQVNYTASNGETRQGWIASRFLDPM